MHHPPHIQSYAYLVVLDADSLSICAHSKNLQYIGGGDAGAMVGRNVSALFSDDTVRLIRLAVANPAALPVNLSGRDEPVDWGDRQVIVRTAADRLLLEVEPCPPLGDHPPENWLTILLRTAQSLSGKGGMEESLQLVCERLVEFLGFDRALVYQLESNPGPGRMKAESNNGTLPSLLGLRFRADDFPQAGYRLHEQESVFNYSLTDAPMVAVVGNVEGVAEAIELRLDARPPYPTLVRFLRESGIKTQLSIALHLEGKCWGVLFAHSAREVYLDFDYRQFARFLGVQLEQKLIFHRLAKVQRQRYASDRLRSRIREGISDAPDLMDGLANANPSLLDFLPNIGGVAIVLNEATRLIGSTPTDEQLAALLTWAAEHPREPGEFIYTDNLKSIYPPASTYVDVAAGSLLVPLNSRATEWIVWFRPENIEEVSYGSRAAGETGPGGGQRFLTTAELHRGVSLPWRTAELATVRELQVFIRDTVMERHNRLTRMNERLQAAYEEMEAFSYTVSHDLRAPLRGIDGFAEILMEEFGPELPAGAVELVRTIQYNAGRMNQFIADILELGRIGRVTLRVNDCDVRRLVEETKKEIEAQLGYSVDVTVAADLPAIRGDFDQLRVVFRQLLLNAVKYSSKQAERQITVGFRAEGPRGDGRFFVSDNGIGIAPQHHQRVFGMFNRLVSNEEYTGSGVGLAIVRRIIQRHMGEVSIQSKPGEGATFLFYTNLPDPTAVRT